MWKVLGGLPQAISAEQQDVHDGVRGGAGGRGCEAGDGDEGKEGEEGRAARRQAFITECPAERSIEPRQEGPADEAEEAAGDTARTGNAAAAATKTPRTCASNATRRAQLAERLRSFDGVEVDGISMPWPHTAAHQLPSAMAAAGLRFAPHADKPDRVVCDACGIDVYGWEEQVGVRAGACVGMRQRHAG